MVRATKSTSALAGILMLLLAETRLPPLFSALGFLALLGFLVFGTSVWRHPPQDVGEQGFQWVINPDKLGRHFVESLLPALVRLLIFGVSFWVCHSLWLMTRAAIH
jgi:hypothetical protein